MKARGAELKVREASLSERIQLAREAIPRSTAPLTLPDSAILETVKQMDEVADRWSANEPTALSAVLATSLGRWAQLRGLAKINVIAKQGLLDEVALAGLIKSASRASGINDIFDVKLMQHPIPEVAAQTFEMNPEAGFTRIGNIVLSENFKTEEVPYWGPEDPGYTRRTLNLVIGVVEKNQV